MVVCHDAADNNCSAGHSGGKMDYRQLVLVVLHESLRASAQGAEKVAADEFAVKDGRHAPLKYLRGVLLSRKMTHRALVEIAAAAFGVYVDVTENHVGVVGHDTPQGLYGIRRDSIVRIDEEYPCGTGGRLDSATAGLSGSAVLLRDE